jgi:hypothetical protein
VAIDEKQALIPREACVLGSAFKRFLGHFNPKDHSRHSEKIFVAAFGKHPGWDDHIDDIGLETEVLIAAKRTLYVQGIGGNVDSGRWDKLLDNQRIAKFNRVIFWHIDGHLVVGRIWSSQDGKGRKSYPFIVCVQCSRLPTQWILDTVLPQLEKIEKLCTATRSADDVRFSIQDARQKLRQLSQQCASSPDSMVVYPDALSRLAERPEMGPGREGLYRILYHIDREVGRLRPGNTKGKALGSTLLRLPVCPNTMLQDVFLWTSFMLTKIGLTTSILVLVPTIDNSWIDIIVGEPTELQLYCLRASLEIIPLTSNIPYNIDQEFVEQAKKLIQDRHSPELGPESKSSRR